MYIYLHTYLPKSPTPLGNYNLQTFYIQLLDIKLLRNNRFMLRGVGTGEAGEASASPDFRG